MWVKPTSVRVDVYLLGRRRPTRVRKGHDDFMVIIFSLPEDLAGAALAYFSILVGPVFMDILYEAIFAFGNVSGDTVSRQATVMSAGGMRIITAAFAHITPESIG